MKNCLVTKLKGSVNNDSLEKLGKIRVLFSNTVNGERVPIIVVGSYIDANVATNLGAAGTPIDTSAGQQVTVTTAGNYEIDVLDKYSVTTFRILEILNNTNIIREQINLSNFKYCTSLTRIEGKRTGTIDYFVGEISDLPTSVTTIDFTGSSRISGQVKDINRLTALTSLRIGNVQGITGDISELNVNNTIELLNIQSCMNITGDTATLGAKLPALTDVSTRLSGTMEDFAAAQVEAGRTSGTCKFTNRSAQTRYIHYSSSYTGGYEINTTP